MAVDIRVVVADAAPLITLAVARSLDYLRYPGVPVLVPDAVFLEATAASGKLGAQQIIDWCRARIPARRPSWRFAAVGCPATWASGRHWNWCGLQSADAVLAAARAGGRNPTTRDLWTGHDPEIRDAVRRILSGGGPGGGGGSPR